MLRKRTNSINNGRKNLRQLYAKNFGIHVEHNDMSFADGYWQILVK